MTEIGPEQLADIIDELQILWPALPIALPRDSGTTSSERVTTSEQVHTVPLNVQVAAVITDLQRAVPDWTRWASTTAGLGATPGADVNACLRRLPGIHHRLHELGRTRDAAKLADAAQRWLSAARKALGLDAPDTPFGEPCPRHDTPLTGLTRPGDIGHLHWTKLDRNGHPVDPTITWTHTDVVLCRHCDSIWTPDRYRWLARLIKQAKTERATVQEAGDAA